MALEEPIDTTVPQPTRRYDHRPGGKDTVAADRSCLAATHITTDYLPAGNHSRYAGRGRPQTSIPRGKLDT